MQKKVSQTILKAHTEKEHLTANTVPWSLLHPSEHPLIYAEMYLCCVKGDEIMHEADYNYNSPLIPDDVVWLFYEDHFFLPPFSFAQ